MVNKQKRWTSTVIVEFYSEDCEDPYESFLKAKDKIEEMNAEVYDTFHGDSQVVYLHSIEK